MKSKCIYIGLVFCMAMMAELSFADEYHSTFSLPNIEVKNQTYRFNVPYAPAPPVAVRARNVSWSWVNQGRSQPVTVELCQMVTNQCLDVTNRPSGSTSVFNSYYAEFPFYFNIRAYRSPFFPIRTLQGSLTVQW